MLNNSEKIKLYKNALDEIASLMDELKIEFPQPFEVKHGRRNTFRHHPTHRSSVLLSYLKTVRGISLLNASLLLTENGYGQEAAILCRIMDEAFEDIMFIGLGHSADITKKHQDFVNEFYQEELSDPDDPLSNIPRHRLPWKEKIASFKPHFEKMKHSYDEFRKRAESIQRTFSGFVHGPYVFIMELFDPHSGDYMMQGNRRPERIEEHLNNYSHYLFKALNAVEAAAGQASRKDIAYKAAMLNLDLTNKTESQDAEGIAAFKKRIAVMYPQE